MLIEHSTNVTIDQWSALRLSSAWLVATSLAALAVFQRVMEPRRS